jgi:hypothetical protein
MPAHGAGAGDASSGAAEQQPAIGPAPFKLERFFEKWEFKAKHLLCCSDCEPLTMPEVLAHADADVKAKWDSLRLSYTEPAGCSVLREAVAGGLYGGAITPEQLLVCAPEEGVYLTMRALLRPGDRVVCSLAFFLVFCFLMRVLLYRSASCRADTPSKQIQTRPKKNPLQPPPQTNPKTGRRLPRVPVALRARALHRLHPRPLGAQIRR